MLRRQAAAGTPQSERGHILVGSRSTSTVDLRRSASYGRVRPCCNWVEENPGTPRYEYSGKEYIFTSFTPTPFTDVACLAAGSLCACHNPLAACALALRTREGNLANENNEWRSPSSPSAYWTHRGFFLYTSSHLSPTYTLYRRCVPRRGFPLRGAA